MTHNAEIGADKLLQLAVINTATFDDFYEHSRSAMTNSGSMLSH